MLEIDGSTMEGGGQILRTAVSLSAILQKPCRIFNIRKGRKKPGLATQHVLGIRALAQLCNGSLKGDDLNSQQIQFFPGLNYKKNISINIPTAASITLLLQALILPALLINSADSQQDPIKITFNGGATDTFFSPTIDYFQHVFLKLLEKIGGKVKINILKRGYYPEGGAKLEVEIFPSELKAINLNKAESFKKIIILSGASELLKDKKVAERQIIGSRQVLGKLKLLIEEKTQYYKTQCPGSHICLIADFKNTVIGTDNLGKLGKRAEDVGKEASLQLLKEQKSEACLDKQSADQILPYLALIPKKSQITVSEITNHCKTNIWTIEQFIKGKFDIKGNLIKWTPATK